MAQCVTRSDVNYVLGELIGELNSSHTYRGGGDTEKPPKRSVGLLGCDYALENGAYRIATIYEGASWDTESRSPLKDPGVNVKEGEYLLAVNGTPVDTHKDPWAALDGMAGSTVSLTVSSTASVANSRQVLVKPLEDESRLRHLAWAQANREKVTQASGGKLGYIYVPDTGTDGQNELYRQFIGQFTKEGLVIDERWNSGGQIPDRFIELLNRPITNYWGVRDGKDWQWPEFAHSGPKVMLINGWSGSGGDCFPLYFRMAKLGPLVGRRTWGGLIGISGSPGLIDGGGVTVPTFGMYSDRRQVARGGARRGPGHRGGGRPCPHGKRRRSPARPGHPGGPAVIAGTPRGGARQTGLRGPLRQVAGDAPRVLLERSGERCSGRGLLPARCAVEG